MKKIDPNKMTPKELQEYCNQLPDKTPPKMSSVAWLAGFGIFAGIMGFATISNPTANTWLMLGGCALSFVGAGYLMYKILTFGKEDDND